MRTRLVSVAIERETDVIVVRQRARKVAALLGFDAQEQTRITTAVSEIVRNAHDYGGGGTVAFHVSRDGEGQALEIVIADITKGVWHIARTINTRTSTSNNRCIS